MNPPPTDPALVEPILLGLRADIAAQADADVFEMSLDLMIRWLPRYAGKK